MSAQYVSVTIFSTGGKFQPVSNFTELHSSCPFLCALVTILGESSGGYLNVVISGNCNVQARINTGQM